MTNFVQTAECIFFHMFMHDYDDKSPTISKIKNLATNGLIIVGIY